MPPQHRFKAGDITLLSVGDFTFFSYRIVSAAQAPLSLAG
jgi:hypothetical protein